MSARLRQAVAFHLAQVMAELGRGRWLASSGGQTRSEWLRGSAPSANRQSWNRRPNSTSLRVPFWGFDEGYRRVYWSVLRLPKRIRTWALLLLAIVAGFVIVFLAGFSLPPRAVTFSQSTRDLEAYDFVEVIAQVSGPHPQNPFTDGAIRSTFQTAAGNRRW